MLEKAKETLLLGSSSILSQDTVSLTDADVKGKRKCLAESCESVSQDLLHKFFDVDEESDICEVPPKIEAFRSSKRVSPTQFNEIDEDEDDNVLLKFLKRAIKIEKL